MIHCRWSKLYIILLAHVFGGAITMAAPLNFKKPNADEIKKKLSDIQYRVTQKDGTEPPFKNAYWDNKKPGLYVDVVTGEPLFSSTDKFDSGTGWPSFTRPVDSKYVSYHEDRKLFMKRVEVRSKIGDSHLGHVFDDGPKPTGKRYCINSAALEFVPAQDLKERGYGEYVGLFETATNSTDTPTQAAATFAGGCFWCMEPPFEKLDGVSAVVSGYMGGEKDKPTYSEVSAGGTGHAEVVQVRYDPTKVSYETLLDVFWRNINPTTPNQQFVDVGDQYRPEIFYHSEEQKKLAEHSRAELEKSGRFKEPIQTKITKAATFYPAEDYHQDYYKKNPIRYKFYRYNSGRDQYLESIWGDNES